MLKSAKGDEAGDLVLRLGLTPTDKAPKSGSGKSLVVGGTSGFQKVMGEGLPDGLSLSVNCVVPNPDYDAEPTLRVAVNKS